MSQEGALSSPKEPSGEVQAVDPPNISMPSASAPWSSNGVLTKVAVENGSTVLPSTTDGAPANGHARTEESSSLALPKKEVEEEAPSANDPHTDKPAKKPWTGPQNGRDLGVWESSLEDRSNCISRWCLNYLDPLLRLGSHKVLEQDDMGVPSREDLAARAHQVAKEAFELQSAKARAANEKLKAAYEAKLAKCTTEEAKKKVKAPVYKEPSIAVALVKGFGTWQLILGMIYYFISAILTFVPVLILNDLVKFFQSGQSINEYQGYAHPWVEVAGLGVIPMIVSLLQTRHQTIMAHCAVFVRTAVSTLLYRKALRVSAAARAQTSTGQVVNMMSNDTAQLQRLLQFIGMILVAPFQIILALALIFLQVRLMPSFVTFLGCPISLSCFSFQLGWQRHVGGGRFHALPGSRKHDRLFHCVQTTPPRPQVFRCSCENDERDPCRPSHHQVLRLGETLWTGGGGPSSP